MTECQKCGFKLPDDAFFCPKCGEKIEEDLYNDNPVESRIIMQIKGGKGEFRYYSAYLKKDGLVVGKSGIINSKMNYTNIAFDDIKNVYFKKSSRLDVVGEVLRVIIIETKDGEKMEILGVPPDPAKTFVIALRRILVGDIDILDREPLTEIKTDDIPIFAGNINQAYINYGKVSVRADSSLFSKTATMDDANARLREEAVKLGANAIINTEYQRSSTTSWRGMKAEGTAVFIESDEKKCPFCAEMIKKEAIKCKHCGSLLNE